MPQDRCGILPPQKKELDRFIKLNYPDSALPELMKLENFYKLMWQAIEKIKQTDPQKLAY